MCRHGMAGSVHSYHKSGKCMFGLVRNCQNVSQVVCDSLHSQQWCAKVMDAPHPYQPSAWSSTCACVYICMYVCMRVHMYVVTRFSHSNMCVMVSPLVWICISSTFHVFIFISVYFFYHNVCSDILPILKIEVFVL